MSTVNVKEHPTSQNRMPYIKLGLLSKLHGIAVAIYSSKRNSVLSCDPVMNCHKRQHEIHSGNGDVNRETSGRVTEPRSLISSAETLMHLAVYWLDVINDMTSLFKCYPGLIVFRSVPQNIFLNRFDNYEEQRKSYTGWTGLVAPTPLPPRPFVDLSIWHDIAICQSCAEIN